MGQNRTVAQIERRVQDLALYLEINHSDDEGDDNVADMSNKKPLRLDDDDDGADSLDATGATASNTMSFNERLKAFYDSDEDEDDDGMGPSMLRKRRNADGEGGAGDSRKKKLQKKVSRIRRSVGGISDSDDDDLFVGDNDKSGNISDDDMATDAPPSLLSQASLKGGLTIPISRARNVMIDSDDEL
jgi:predicted AlkP superfamily pyrophosphatase or phosphodiesterase